MSAKEKIIAKAVNETSGSGVKEIKGANGGDDMLEALIRAALTECAGQRRFPAAAACTLGDDVFAWTHFRREDGL